MSQENKAALKLFVVLNGFIGFAVIIQLITGN